MILYPMKAYKLRKRRVNMVIGMSETPTPTQTTTPKKKKTKKKEETQPTPTPTPTPTPPTQTPPKEEVTQPPKKAPKKAEKKAEKEVKKEAKETKEAKPETKPTTKPATKPKPKIKTTTWEKFEKFETKTKTEKKTWIKDIIEKAKREPVKVTGLTRGQLMALIASVNRHNASSEPKILIKYDTTKGIAMLAPLTKTHPKTQ
jgi:hypothetical protein